MGVPGWQPAIKTGVSGSLKEGFVLAGSAAPSSVPQQVLQYFLQFGFTAAAVTKLYTQDSWAENSFTPTTTVVTC